MANEDSLINTQDSLRKIVHDLNGVIFLIHGHIELARSTCEDSETRDQLNAIHGQTNELDEICKRIRALRNG